MREHIAHARREVDQARSGTRALAARFRGVPLPDELENAADLLRAAGLRVELAVDTGAAAAPREALGPVVRESTTNILKHGGGRFARLRLDREGDQWHYRSENDRAADDTARPGTGIESMTTRVSAAGGTLSALGDGELFTLDARVPDRGRS
ncbi:hypothetical protein [Microbacterium sp. SORGH_AS_0888]|uniref:hypothetical protein n=1 Tax=Microbacterium sp. SORGH_AS_0888 TaxID=3041791 RepID=UPI0027862D57|nr:hypothetical protein [Microbacterium sp. SORGH_AS_0888]MDQ1130304.1 signal transduction histidine kinase [Microbacterium sp. SORGH_AS_0888]